MDLIGISEGNNKENVLEASSGDNGQQFPDV